MENKIILLCLFGLLLVSCAKVNVEDVINEPFNYTTYTSDGFSIKYPDWPQHERGNETEVSVSRGFCTVIIDTADIPAESWYQQLIVALKDAPHILSFEENEEELSVKSTATYKEHKLISKMKVAGCNKKSHLINIACLETVIGYEAVTDLYNSVLDSISCEETKAAKEESKEKKVSYEKFVDSDFELLHPDWSEIEEGEHILGVSAGICSVVVNKHNALPGDLFNWILKSLPEQEGSELIESDKKGEVYTAKYTSDYKEHKMISDAKFFYCNYQTYFTAVVCIENMLDDEFREIRDVVLNSAQCTKEYKVPEPKITKEIKEEEPEIVEKIKKEIVKTDAAEEFGLDAEGIVYFINENTFFTKVMSDFGKANLVFDDAENDRELKLKVKLDKNGKIVLLDDGHYSDADITLYVPLIDALNILNNAANINPLNLITFAVHVTTDPPEIKNQVIQNVLKGKYN
ncbi:hypothetical protein KY346_06655 [Candidatus Woesearchaeota archaeon]|nr:hypothetical protein [Candidatus Woesearchaeota archaeon]